MIPPIPGTGRFCLLLILMAASLRAQIVLNEIFYHAPEDLSDLQWIELHNPTEKAVDLAGWKLSKGVKFLFPRNTAMAPNGYLVVCRSQKRFQQFYDVPVAGEFEKSLKRSGERIDLENAAGALVDSVVFSDRSPWPRSPDGESASLERICPTAPGSVPENWASSPLADRSKPFGGTPGKQNANFSASLPPIISQVRFTPARAEPGQSIQVEATVQDEVELRTVEVLYRVAGPGFEREESALPMTKVEGNRYSAAIPGQQTGQIVRFRIHAANPKSAQRYFPGEYEPQPAFSCLVHTNVAPGKIPFGHIITTKTRAMPLPAPGRQRGPGRPPNQPNFMRPPGTPAWPPAPSQSAFVWIGPETREPVLFDFVECPERSGGWKVHFGKDHSLMGMTGINLIFEASDRWLLSEALAYELHRRAGVAACRTDFVRLWVNGRPVGYHLLIEQPNKAFLRRNGLRDDGNLYKATWMGNGLVGQHEKKFSRYTGHDDLIELDRQLQKTKTYPAAQWDLIKKEFDVEQVINHYAVRMLIADWDGFFNNYYLYHDLNGTKKWTFYPWDEDKTWGDFDGGDWGGLLYNMPLTHGAEGDQPPGGRLGGFRGNDSWWRPGGYISKPLLANPVFRRHFLARLKELIGTEFTEARLFPLIDQFRDRLLDEVRYQAGLVRENPVRAQQRLESNLASLKEFIIQRRRWLLTQKEVTAAGPFERAQLK